MLRRRKETGIDGALQVVLHLGDGADRDRHIAREISIGTTTSSLRYRGGNRVRGFFELFRERSLSAHEALGNLLAPDREIVGHVPHDEFSEISHGRKLYSPSPKRVTESLQATSFEPKLEPQPLSEPAGKP